MMPSSTERVKQVRLVGWKTALTTPLGWLHAASNRPAGQPDDGALQTQITTTTVRNVTTTYTSAGPTITLTADVDGFGLPVAEGRVQFTLDGTSQTATISPNNPGVANATIALSSTIAAGSYTIEVSYSDPNSIYTASSGVGTLALNTADSTVTVTGTNTPHRLQQQQRDARLASERQQQQRRRGQRGFHRLHGQRRLFRAGRRQQWHRFDDAHSVEDIAPHCRQLSQRHLGNLHHAATNNYASANATGAVMVTGGKSAGAGPTTTTITSSTLSDVHNSTTVRPTPVGSLSPFALALGPTGIDMFEIDSQGGVFAQSLFGGGLQRIDTSLQLPLAVLSNEGLLAMLAGINGQNYLLDVFDPLLPLVESAVLAALHL
jgi:hypothetical protein